MNKLNRSKNRIFIFDQKTVESQPVGFKKNFVEKFEKKLAIEKLNPIFCFISLAYDSINKFGQLVPLKKKYYSYVKKKKASKILKTIRQLKILPYSF